MKNTVYGYCRISTQKQSIERQRRNISKSYPDAILIEDEYTGTKVQGRRNFEKLLKTVKTGDTIVFDSVSRMSRNAAEGVQLYKELYNKGVNLVFLKEHYIDTDTYKTATAQAVPMTGTDVDLILSGVNQYMMRLAERQIEIAFDQAEKEVQDLRQRTKEGLVTAKLNGMDVGRKHGDKLTTKKGERIRETILKHSKDFGGSLNDIEVITLLSVTRNTYYKYKSQLREEWE